MDVVFTKVDLDRLPKSSNATLSNIDALKGLGTGTVSALAEGDIIMFPPSSKDVQIITRTFNGSRPFESIGVMRNGQPYLLGLGTLNRKDAENKPVCPFVEEMDKMIDHKARVEHLIGKTITVKSLVEVNLPVFANGSRTEEAKPGYLPYLEYAE